VQVEVRPPLRCPGQCLDILCGTRNPERFGLGRVITVCAFS
jgi:hypothetical protein